MAKEKIEETFYLRDKALVQVDADCYMEIIVTEVRREFGRTRYTVEPIAGKGEMKVEKLFRMVKPQI